jgi:hypothetical protein
VAGDVGYGVQVANSCAGRAAIIKIEGGKITANVGVSVIGDDQGTEAWPAYAYINDGADITGTAGTTSGVGIMNQGYGAKVYVNGGTVTGSEFGISGNGTAGLGGTYVEVNGGTIKGNASDGAGIYQPQDGTLIINGGTITGGDGVQVCAGSLTVTGGTIEGTGSAMAKAARTGSGGSVETGSAVSVINRTGYSSVGAVDLTGGTMNSANGEAVSVFSLDGSTVSDWADATSHVSVTGGQYSDESALKYVPAGYTMSKNENGEWIVAKDQTEEATPETTPVSSDATASSTGSALASTGDNTALPVATGVAGAVAVIAAGALVYLRRKQA